MAPSPEFDMSESIRAVFLSYTSKDVEAARRICDSLRRAGIEVWLDPSELRGRDAWDAAIRKQIKTCALFMPVISANTSARVEGYFRLEWKLAVVRSHRMAAERALILPVVIDETREVDALVPDRFREVQWTRCPQGEVPATFTERIVRLLSPQQASTGDLQRAKTTQAFPSAVPHNSRRRVSTGVVLGIALLAVGSLLAYKTALRSAAIGVVAVLPFEYATGDRRMSI